MTPRAAGAGAGTAGRGVGIGWLSAVGEGGTCSEGRGPRVCGAWKVETAAAGAGSWGRGWHGRAGSGPMYGLGAG